MHTHVNQGVCEPSLSTYMLYSFSVAFGTVFLAALAQCNHYVFSYEVKCSNLQCTVANSLCATYVHGLCVF